MHYVGPIIQQILAGEPSEAERRRRRQQRTGEVPGSVRRRRAPGARRAPDA